MKDTPPNPTRDEIVAYLSRPENADVTNAKAARDLGVHEARVRRARAVMPEPAPPPPTMVVPGEIVADPTLQPRAATDDAAVAEFAAAYSSGDDLPPVVIFRTPDCPMLLAHGFHRVAAALRAGLAEIPAEVREGTRSDALAYAVAANLGNRAVRLTTADRRRAVELMLADPTIRHWSDRRIAESCGVSGPTVAARRGSPTAKSLQSSDEPEVRVGRDGRAYSVPAAITPTEAPEGTHRETPTAKILQSCGADAPPENIRVDPKVSPEVPAPFDFGKTWGPSANESPAPSEPHTADAPPPFEGESPSPPSPPTDAEWLAEMPIRERLSDRCRAIFDADAVAYRHIVESESFRKHATEARKEIATHKPGTVKGLYLYRLGLSISPPHPRSWLLCSLCNGTGSCDGCKRRGYAFP